MQINVKLEGNTLATMDFNEPVILPEKELILAFQSNTYRLYSLLLSVRNEIKTKQYKLNQSLKADISEFLTPSTIEAEISLLSKGNIAKTWRIPSILVKEHKPTFELTPEIAELRQNDAEQRQAIAELLSILKNNNLI